MLFTKPKIWFIISINKILTCKSKNARMGAGVGSLVRLTTELKKHVIFLKIKLFNMTTIRPMCHFFKYKCSLNFKFITKNSKLF